ncbi:hypothetical protein EPI10_011319 [Gossypium australe]|uniref:Uncharacterized protein n=1 Tax=Gossypium australe TaxID=47621 RepID=A0A5B6W852_9ROSI|nr:hypothetical protein EPI10_011319 [Gossypium australe]
MQQYEDASHLDPANTPPVPTNTPCGDKIYLPSKHTKLSTDCSTKSTERLCAITERLKAVNRMVINHNQDGTEP